MATRLPFTTRLSKSKRQPAKASKQSEVDLTKRQYDCSAMLGWKGVAAAGELPAFWQGQQTAIVLEIAHINQP